MVFYNRYLSKFSQKTIKNLKKAAYKSSAHINCPGLSIKALCLQKSFIICFKLYILLVIIIRSIKKKFICLRNYLCVCNCYCFFNDKVFCSFNNLYKKKKNLKKIFVK